MCINPYHKTFLDKPTKAWKVIRQNTVPSPSFHKWRTGPCFGVPIIPNTWIQAKLLYIKDLVIYGFCVMPRREDADALLEIYNSYDLKLVCCMVKGELRIGYEADYGSRYKGDEYITRYPSGILRTAWAAEWIRFEQGDLDALEATCVSQ